MMSPSQELRPSKRIRFTDEPCIVAMQRMLRGKDGIMSLAQGIVHWSPPASALEAARKAAEEADTNSYCADDGLPVFREALKEKLKKENGLEGVEVMVTAGANQAYTNLVCTLLDEEDSAVLFRPFYFNHRMALQMTGGHANVVLAPSTKEYLPDVEWLEKRLSQPINGERIRMRHQVWLVVDNTYEHFTYEEEGHAPHFSISGDHVVNVFSFSKAFGMMGWRIGYLAFPPILGPELMKVQDTIAICPAVASQKAALAALDAGRQWVKEHVRGLKENRRLVVAAVEDTLGKGAVAGGSGAIYLMVKLPDGFENDTRVVEWLSEKHKVCAIPGSACGAPGELRLCYANLPPAKCVEAAERLKAGLAELRKEGPDIIGARSRHQILALAVSVQAVQVTVQIPSNSLKRWQQMCRDEQQDEGGLLSSLISTRKEILDAQPGAPAPPKTLQPITEKVASTPSKRCQRFKLTVDGAQEVLGLARTELDCPDVFMKAVVIFGRVLLSQQRLLQYDILHEAAKLSQKSVDPLIFQDFMNFQEDLAKALEGWALWEYEFKHWRYTKRRAGPPTRLRDLSRFADAHVSAMTVDNWRAASYRDFLSEDYNYNVSHFSGGDPTLRLSKAGFICRCLVEGSLIGRSR
eukprot:symbB.v1.2.013356.t1/scaffold942.1/size149982/7